MNVSYTAFEVVVIPICLGVLLGMLGGLVVFALAGLIDALFAARSRKRTSGEARAFRAMTTEPPTRRQTLARR